MSELDNAETARRYVWNWRTKLGKKRRVDYVDFPSGRIHLNEMTDEQAIKVAYGLREIEEQAKENEG